MSEAFHSYWHRSAIGTMGAMVVVATFVMAYGTFVYEIRQCADWSVRPKEPYSVACEQVVGSHWDALWLILTTEFQVLYGEIVPTSRMGCTLCLGATFIGLLIASTVISSFMKWVKGDDFISFGLQARNSAQFCARNSAQFSDAPS